MNVKVSALSRPSFSKDGATQISMGMMLNFGGCSFLFVFVSDIVGAVFPKSSFLVVQDFCSIRFHEVCDNIQWICTRAFGYCINCHLCEQVHGEVDFLFHD